jgi:predicted component of viral defense system (DUF524 family)
VSQLARIETDGLVVELSGPSDYPAALQPRVEIITPYFSASVNQHSIATQVSPVLFEERNYEIVARSKSADSQPVVTFRDPTLIVQKTVVPEAGLVALTVRFRGQVGRTSFSVRVGDETLVIEAEVYPSKIDYLDDYAELLDDVARVHRALVLEYLRATFRQGLLEREDAGSGIEWLSLLRQYVGELREAIQYVNIAPRRTLVRENATIPIHRVKGSNASVVRAIARGLGSGDTQHLKGIGSVRAQIQVPRSYESLDTLEHRWLRSRLKTVLARLTELEVGQQHRVDRSIKRSGKRPPRLVAELAEISAIKDEIGHLLESPVISAATLDVPTSTTSIQLQSGIGYSQAYRVLTALGAALAEAAGPEQYSTSDLNELYETWCFLKVAQVVAELLGTEVDYSELIPSDASGLRFTLHKGLARSVKLPGKFVQAALVYNPSFDVPTGVQKPDIVLRIAASGGVDAFVVLDAKYRVDASSEYVKQFGAPGAPVDAVNQLHRYRDAIQVIDAKEEVIRPVVAGVALFPWAEPATDYRLRESADEVGIGALPFMPGNDADLRNWLTSLFASLGLTVIGSDGRHLRLVG